jgi:hypothetical protein
VSNNHNSIQKRTFTAIRAEFSGIAFRRGKDNIGGFVLQGIPEKIFQDICSRLFMLKCKLINHYFSEVSNTYAIHFTASAEVAARLALLFPCPTGYLPLKIGGTQNKPVILYGKAADKAKFAKLQEVR